MLVPAAPTQAEAGARPASFDAGNVALTYRGQAPDYIKLIKEIKLSPLVCAADGKG